MVVPEAADQRFICWNRTVPWVEAYGWLARFNSQGAKVPTKLADGEDEKVFLWNNDKSKKILGMQYIDAEATIVDMAESCIKAGKYTPEGN